MSQIPGSWVHHGFVGFVVVVVAAAFFYFFYIDDSSCCHHAAWLGLHTTWNLWKPLPSELGWELQTAAADPGLQRYAAGGSPNVLGGPTATQTAALDRSLLVLLGEAGTGRICPPGCSCRPGPLAH